MKSSISVAEALSRVRAWRIAANWAPYRYAIEAGVAEASLRGMDHDDWNPTVRTLRKLEAVIPAEWRLGDNVPPKADASTLVAPATTAEGS